MRRNSIICVNQQALIYDAVVIGGGPAGSAVTLGLRAAGKSVVVLEKTAGDSFKAGEGIHPAATPLLLELGIHDLITQGEHLPCYGNESVWGSSSVHQHSFFNGIYNQGWHLDRQAFDVSLRGFIVSKGATVLTETELLSWQYDPSARLWTLLISTDAVQQTIQTRWLVDCSGRKSIVAKQTGLKRQADDYLFGYYMLFEPLKIQQEKPQGSLTFVEAVANGWWYSAVLPQGKKIVICFTDSRLRGSGDANNIEGFHSMLGQTEHLATRLNRDGFVSTGQPQGLPANSTYLESSSGEAWLAVGDAAYAFDPLSSQGIQTALYGGQQAAQAIAAFDAGVTTAVIDYSAHMKSVYQAYLDERDAVYRQEMRWPESEFWRLKHQKRDATDQVVVTA